MAAPSKVGWHGTNVLDSVSRKELVSNPSSPDLCESDFDKSNNPTPSPLLGPIEHQPNIDLESEGQVPECSRAMATADPLVTSKNGIRCIAILNFYNNIYFWEQLIHLILTDIFRLKILMNKMKKLFRDPFLERREIDLPIRKVTPLTTKVLVTKIGT